MRKARVLTADSYGSRATLLQPTAPLSTSFVSGTSATTIYQSLPAPVPPGYLPTSTPTFVYVS